MKKHLFSLFLVLVCACYQANAQNTKAQLMGKITDNEGQPLSYASLAIMNTPNGTYADSTGNYRFLVPANQNFICIIQFVGYIPKKIPLKLAPNEIRTLNIRLQPDPNANLKEVTVKSNKLPSEKVSIFHIPPKLVKTLPTPFGDFNKILATLPGVVSNSELSSSYSVRGGNFDENLVYVNNIEVYRPFLIRAGQQEGLSFINPDLVQKVEFSAGGWQAKYGDKLSSALIIDYKTPTKWGGSVSWGLLGGTAHLEGASNNKKFSFVAGVRHKDSRYLLNTLPTSGEYLPRFTDVQGLFRYKFSPNTSLEWLTAYARNNYLVRPSARQTTFGTLDQPFRLLVAFDGQETMQYSLFQNALKLTHHFNKNLRTEWLVSGMNTREREFIDVEGGYRLCDIVPDPSTNTNRCVAERSIGTIYEYGRNRLQAVILSAANRNRWSINNHLLEFGVRYNAENIQDILDEHSFIDSAGFTSVNQVINNKLSLISHRFSGYVQHSFNINNLHTFNYGVRLGYWNINQELLISPRFQYAFSPDWKRPTVFKASVGVYQQPPFYRELRDRQGNLNLNLKAQQSLHVIGGVESSFKVGDRRFKWTAEAYYKYIENAIPYDIDNVRIRYFAENNATAFATGVDVRISGEFVKGSESWFSLGLMNVREDVDGDGQGYIRRPTDQRLTFAAYFEDYLPNNPTFRAYVNMIYGTGLPFGPPNNDRFRSALSGRAYRRIDVGFSKVIAFDNIQVGNARILKSLWIGLEVLNILAAENTISYNWITDTNRRQYAIPNTLSTRFLNLRLIGNF